MSSRVNNPYRKYLLVWLDIIGFEARIEKSMTRPEEAETIVGILREADATAKWVTKAYRRAGIRARTISDSVIMTCPAPDSVAVHAVVVIVSLYQMLFMWHRLFLRGAMMVDSHYSSGNIAFGPGINRLMKMEKPAVWPRVVVHPTVIREMAPASYVRVRQVLGLLNMPHVGVGAENDMERVDRDFRRHIDWLMLARSDDGLRFVDYLRTAFLSLTALRWAYEYRNQEAPGFVKSDLLATHKDVIVATIKAEGDKDKIEILSKYHSLAKYHNRTIGKLSSGLSKPFDISHVALDKYADVMYWNSLASLQLMGTTLPDKDVDDFLVARITEISREAGGLGRYRIDLPDTFPEFYRKLG